MTHLLDCEIVAHQEVAPLHRRMALRAPAIAECAVAGQFCMVEVHNGIYPFLRRPMSIERIFKDGFSILYKIVGAGTRLLAELSVGDSVNIQGPLGNGFPVETGFGRYLLVGGGIGVAPLPGLAEAIIRRAGHTPEIILAARNEQFLLCLKEFAQMGCTVRLATDDGSAGLKGFASDALRAAAPDGNTAVYACGPTVMMRAIHEVCLEANAPCWASLEAEMACGDGVCMGCVVETNAEEEARRMARVCHEGPVFFSRDINWNAGTPPHA